MIILQITDEQWARLSFALGVATGEALDNKNQELAKSIMELFGELQREVDAQKPEGQ